MSSRSNLSAFRAQSPATFDGLRAISQGTLLSGLDPELVELVKLRVSQINGCAFCLATHLAEARRLGMAEGRLHLLSAWRESSLFSAAERAALAWAEALTGIADGPVSDAVFDEAAGQFDAEALANLTGAVVAINGFNRVAAAYRFAHPPMAPAS